MCAVLPGWWNGREVDIYEPVVPSCEKLVEWQSGGHLIMQRMGLKRFTFELLGHLTRDGVVIGNVFEASHGRLVEFSDRAAVYEAVATIQRKNVIYRDISTGEIFITGTGVRFGQGVSSVIFVPDKNKLEEEADWWHWGKLERLFNKLKDAPFNDAWTTRKMSSTELLIPRLPSPTRPIPIIPNFSRHAFAFGLFVTDSTRWLSWITRSSESKETNGSRKQLIAPMELMHSRRRTRRIDATVDEPLVLSTSRVRHLLTNSRHPYSRGNYRRTIFNHVTATSDRDDTTISSDGDDITLVSDATLSSEATLSSDRDDVTAMSDTSDSTF